MKIKNIKDLCEEHDRLQRTVEVIDFAIDNHHWMMIKTPNGESYLSNEQIKAVYDLAKSRMEEIENKLEI